MSELEKHIEKKIPFYYTKEGEAIIVYPAELRMTYRTIEDVYHSAVFKNENYFLMELQSIERKGLSFNSLRPTKP